MRVLLAIVLTLITSLAVPVKVLAGEVPKRIVVDPSGKGDYRTIQAALNSLPYTSEEPRTIFIRKGTYNEKIYIEKHNIILLGEDRTGTVVTQSIARDAWRCAHNDDWGVATINVDGNDITLQNLTVVNSFGFDWKEDVTIPCKQDTVKGVKMLTKIGHQMALRTMSGNRFRAINCHFRAFGGDTVSPWDVQNGMFYFKDCTMEGGVDFYCPRGWAWAENCKFISHSGTAAIWHDGSRHQDSKTVLKNCSFEGFDGFNLGRYHRDAQFYLINCTFPQNMADKDIYLVPTTNAILWGRRVYYYNTHRTGGDYAWHKDNLQTALGAPRPEDITVEWLFGNKWLPHTNNPLPKAHARLRKKDSKNQYGTNLTKEIMPVQNPATDFTKVPIPLYQTEGPTWENDKIGFRLYFDVRNGKDIFGKTNSAMVMDSVGTYGDKFYHHFDKQWGMDILKVGKSLGAGALALQVKSVQGKDTLVRLGGSSVGRTRYELVKDGPEEAIIRLYYDNWQVLNRTYQLIEEISIKQGDYFYESKVTIKGLKGDERLVTGIVNLKGIEAVQLKKGDVAAIYTHGKQSENNDNLGMAILVQKSAAPVFGKAPESASDILNTYTVALKATNNIPVVFRFYAGWEQTDKRFADKAYFQDFLTKEAAAWNNMPTNKETKLTKSL